MSLIVLAVLGGSFILFYLFKVLTGTDQHALFRFSKFNWFSMPVPANAVGFFDIVRVVAVLLPLLLLMVFFRPIRSGWRSFLRRLQRVYPAEKGNNGRKGIVL